MTVSTDRWTCPHIGCPRPTFVAVGSDADARAAIVAVQHRHADAHRHAAGVLEHLGLPPAKKAAKPRPKRRPRRASTP